VTTIRATVRNGRIELEHPLALPDGTEIVIPIPQSSREHGLRDKVWSNSPEDIDAWIRWYDALEPLVFTANERQAWENARREDRERELAQWENSSEQIERQFS
jgi:hypothetical protein